MGRGGPQTQVNSYYMYIELLSSCGHSVTTGTNYTLMWLELTKKVYALTVTISFDLTVIPV